MTESTHVTLAERYELRERIGQGGMGTVWLGRDLLLNRTVAIKQIGLSPGGGQPNLLRAEREAHLAARVSHENVVAVYDLVHDGQHQWLVMEHVDGPSLAGRIAEQGPIPPAEVRALLAQVASSLQAAHDHGIVHRDVKPSNILLTRDHVAKLSDFGIARADSDESLTQTGLVSGSPTYLSPEVLTGRPATPASDVWSLGATMFHALAGRPAYEPHGHLMSTMEQIVHGDPPRLPAVAPLSALVTQMMQVDPHDRPTMAEVKAALQRSSASGTTVFRPVAPAPAEPRHISHRATTEAPRSSRWWIIGALALVVFVLAALFAAGVLGGGGSTSSDTSTSAPATTEPSSAPTTDSGSSSGPTAAALEGFASDYLTAADNDPEQGFAMLTPAYQNESGGLEGYEGFWGDVDDLKIEQISADPDSLTVSYTYSYDFKGERRTEDVTLQLKESGDTYLVAGAQ